MQLSWPVSPVKINQIFGVNGAYYQQNGINIEGHNGLDLGITHGQPVYAAHDGTAYFELDGNQGHGIVICANDTMQYAGRTVGYKTIYWHMVNADKEPQFNYMIPTDGKGYAVKRGQLLGYGDSTGLSTGDHLHFGLKPIVPGESDALWYNLVPNNGYLGAIDPLPYLPFTYALTRDLGVNSVGTDVYTLQNFLVKRGIASFAPTGFFGPKTKQAVMTFQSIYKIPVTGFVGLVTRTQISVILNQ